MEAAVKLVEGVVKLSSADLDCFRVPGESFFRNRLSICHYSKLLRQRIVAKRIRRTCQLF